LIALDVKFFKALAALSCRSALAGSKAEKTASAKACNKIRKL
jgi:hypothetical protein